MAVSARPALLLRSPITTATRALLTAASPVRPLLARSTFRARIATIAMATPPAVELWVKGDPKTDTLLDCPYCHRALLTAETKAVPYKRGFIDFAAKPDWLLEVNPSGAVPVMKVLADGAWIVGSDVISDWFEEHYPEPRMGKVGDAPDAGGDVFPALVAFLKAPAGAEGAEKEAALADALARLGAWLTANGPFLGPGAGFGSGDASLAPKLHHLSVALPHFKKGGWSWPAGSEPVRSYLDRVRALPAWKACAYGDDAVIAGWNRHLAH